MSLMMMPDYVRQSTHAGATLTGALLQRKCACGNASGIGGACDDCRRHELTGGAGEFAASHNAPPARAGAHLHDDELNRFAHSSMRSAGGHSFGEIRVHHEKRAVSQSDMSAASVRAEVMGTEEEEPVEQPDTMETSDETGDAAETVVDETEQGEELQQAQCPLTAAFSFFVVGGEKQTCQVPDGKFGIARLARFIVHGNTGGSSLTVGERFTKLDDPYNVFDKLKPVSATTKNNMFDDCYSIFTDKPLPSDFVLKVEQNHIINGQVVSKNQITYLPDRVGFCTHKRRRGSCDFAARCSK